MNPNYLQYEIGVELITENMQFQLYLAVVT